MNDFEQDIINELELKFEENFATAKIHLLKFLEGSQNETSNRIIRSIIHLSNGNLEDLKANIKIAEKDWRDIIYYAEYDDNNRTRNFNNPFPNSQIQQKE